MRKNLLFLLPMILFGLIVGGCKSPEPAAANANTMAANATASNAGGPGYRPVATIKDLMDSEVDPSADYIWDAVSTVISEKGIEEKFPKTPKDWAEIRRKAVTLVEATNLLIMPGRKVARPGEKSENPGIELSPEEINTILDKDHATFEKHAGILHDAAMNVLNAIDAKDKEKILDGGAAIDEACEGCHKIYWYPNEGAGKTAPSLKK